MKTIIIGDLHLNTSFDKVKYDLLQKIISSADFVILNGDFWDAHLCTFGEFLTSRWQSLFPLLKSKNAYYIYGNHDRREFSDTRIDRFCTDSGYEYNIETNKGVIHVEHGDRVAPSLDDKIKLLQKLNHWRIWRLGNAVFNRLYPSYLNEKQRDKQTNRLVAYWSKEQQKQQPYYAVINSHVHRQNHIPSANLYITGAIDKQVARYIEIEDGEIRLMSA